MENKALRKTVFLDRDGTINEEVSYLHKVEDFRFLPHVLEGLSILAKADFQLVVVTNQAGIGRGYYGEKDAEVLHSYLREELQKRDIFLKGIYYLPPPSEGDRSIPKRMRLPKAQSRNALSGGVGFATGE